MTMDVDSGSRQRPAASLRSRLPGAQLPGSSSTSPCITGSLRRTALGGRWTAAQHPAVPAMAGHGGQMLYWMSSCLFCGKPVDIAALEDGMSDQKELSCCSCPSYLVGSALILESAVD